MGNEGNLDDTIAATPTSPKALATGQVFADRYRIEDMVGLGGMGEVYRVYDLSLGETIALKLLALAGPAHGSAVERFRREVRVARKVTHRNVARTHDLGEHEGVYYLTMEYVEGPSLDTLLEEDGPQEPARAAELCLQVARGLGAAHRAGIVHRDLKPANVLLAPDGRVVITDFGIAHGAREEVITVQGNHILGTPGYMAPEQVLGESIDARTDLYGLGTMLYELLTGRLPFEADNVAAIALARVQRPPTDPRQYGDLPTPLVDITLWCLAREPGARPADADTVADSLTQWLGTRQTGAQLVGSARSSVISQPFAPVLRNEPALAVLPLRYRGPKDEDYIAEGIGEDLVDALSRTRGLRVMAMGATAHFATERDPRAVGLALDIETIVDATVRRAGDRVRVDTRLLDTKTGTQVWSGTFEGPLGDLFEAQERIARRIAEALRLELSTSRYRGAVPAEAVDLYLRARSRMKSAKHVGAGGSVELLERAIELAPGFDPAVATHAVACARAPWDEQLDGSRDWMAVARASIERARGQAPELAETHLAAAMLANQVGDYALAARSLARTLELAPTCADAHQVLGELQLEAGRPREGRRRLELALSLDPTLTQALFGLLRSAALEERWQDVEELMSRLEGERQTIGYLTLRLRFGMWRQDEATIRAAVQGIHQRSTPMAYFLGALGNYVLGELPVDAARSLSAKLDGVVTNPRVLTLGQQLTAEAHGYLGQSEACLESIERGAALVLCDLGWLDGHPVLAPIRDDERFVEARRLVQIRAANIWAG